MITTYCTLHLTITIPYPNTWMHPLLPTTPTFHHGVDWEWYSKTYLSDHLRPAINSLQQPLKKSQLTAVVILLPVSKGHLSITAMSSQPIGGRFRQVSLYTYGCYLILSQLVWSGIFDQRFEACIWVNCYVHWKIFTLHILQGHWAEVRPLTILCTIGGLCRKYSVLWPVAVGCILHCLVANEGREQDCWGSDLLSQMQGSWVVWEVCSRAETFVHTARWFLLVMAFKHGVTKLGIHNAGMLFNQDKMLEVTHDLLLRHFSFSFA